MSEEKLPKRRIIRGIVNNVSEEIGTTDLVGGESEVALRLSNVYEAERRRHVSMSRPDAAYSPNAFTKQMGEARAARRWGGEENIEDNPGGLRRPPKVDIWYRIARKVIEARYDPDTFIRRQFAMLPPGDQPPSPEALSGAKADENYRRGQLVSRQEIELAWRFQPDKCKVAITRVIMSSLGLKGEDAWARVLNDLTIELTALFRYCLAVDLVKRKDTKNKPLFSRVAERFRNAAAMQYVFDADSYDQVWRAKIPAGFRDEAGVIYRRFHGMDGGNISEEF